jgi:hypothetical protein
MAVTTQTKPLAALTALKELQEDAKRKGLDRITMDEINTEIATYRREKRTGVVRPPKPPEKR